LLESYDGIEWAQRRLMGQLPFYRNLIRHLRYVFAGEPMAIEASPARFNVR
jgi:hypothetical protein